MFERYTEKARRVIFFARYEASQFGSPVIESEHLLLGLMREDKKLVSRFLRSLNNDSIRKQIETHVAIREKIATSVDLPLSDECKRILAFAAEEAERLGNKHIGTEHLLLGLLREDKCFAAGLMKEHGVQLDVLRKDLVETPHEVATTASAASEGFLRLFKDLTQSAVDGQLEPIIARDIELDSLIEILSNRNKRNPVLLGELGVGKTAIVEGLAQRIADGKVPSFLSAKRILAIEQEFFANWAMERQNFDEPGKLFGSSVNPADIILFIDGLQGLLPSRSKTALNFGAALKFALLRAGVQCICAGNDSDYNEVTKAMPWLGQCFRAVYVRPFDEASTLAVLQTRKKQFEKYYDVTYSDDAIEFAAHSSINDPPECSLLVKALELLDAAGALVKLRQSVVPEEIMEIQKRIHFISHRMDNAVVNHEFEKARFYSNELNKEKENLRALKETLQPESPSSMIVGKEEVAEVVSRWAIYPYRP